ncbi:chitinase [Nonomuraea terrae]|uniref:Chitinase n=1 Tax=Nonomuraea terrae TaxID=2530383 RepID=A0A4R4YYY6_9ACTN|nr:chitinase [Nonomuraea terrae]TDD50220.1 chitinase [Nonomuraea terrae]
MSRHNREPGLLPRPLAVLAALALAAATAVAVRLLPADAARPPVAARPAVSPTITVAPPPQKPPPAFVEFVDTARDPGLDLPGEARRSGVRHYALGHLVAGGDGCAPRWTGRLALGRNPVANRIGRLRALGGDAVPIFGGPGGKELAVACPRPAALAAAYRRVVGAFGAEAVEFEVRDGADRAAVLRRARALRAVQHERPLRVVLTLPLTPEGLEPSDVTMLRLTRREGAEVATVNLLATVEPRAAGDGRLRRMAAAVRAARDQIARAHGLATPEEAWPRIALTPVLAGAGDLSRADARTLAAYADRHGLAWLSLRGVNPIPDVLRILWSTSP